MGCRRSVDSSVSFTECGFESWPAQSVATHVFSSKTLYHNFFSPSGRTNGYWRELGSNLHVHVHVVHVPWIGILSKGNQSILSHLMPVKLDIKNWAGSPGQGRTINVLYLLLTLVCVLILYGFIVCDKISVILELWSKVLALYNHTFNNPNTLILLKQFTVLSRDILFYFSLM